jgi:hypothetical protein
VARHEKRTKARSMRSSNGGCGTEFGIVEWVARIRG